MKRHLFSFAIITSSLIPAAGDAQEMREDAASANCPATAAPLPTELRGWASPVPLAAAETGAKAPLLTISKGATVSLLPTPQVTYPLRPEKPGGSVSYGGLLGFIVAKEGTYRVALSGGPWIDVVRSGKAVISTAHGHGPACTGIRKMVDFPLTPGRYLLQISASGAATMTAMVTPLP